ncbi:MAG: hypothetical protein EPN26_08840 [Rhodospirillales bacterium]|nr:MAG: hypothetical protein EPN26_08840 [Rhodospirillales bacterium]
MIDPPSDALRKKAPPSAQNLEAALKKAVVAVERAGQGYPERLAKDCARLKEMSVHFSKTQAKVAMDDIRFLAHDMKGQGGQFGYPLITAICDRLQTYLAPIEAPGPRTAEIACIYVDALLLVESKKMTGEGGEAGRLLLANLSKLTG